MIVKTVQAWRDQAQAAYGRLEARAPEGATLADLADVDRTDFGLLIEAMVALGLPVSDDVLCGARYAVDLPSFADADELTRERMVVDQVFRTGAGPTLVLREEVRAVSGPVLLERCVTDWPALGLLRGWRAVCAGCGETGRAYSRRGEPQLRSWAHAHRCDPAKRDMLP